MATAIIRPTSHIEHSNSSYSIRNFANMYDGNDDTFAQGKSSLYGYGILQGFYATNLNITAIKKITLCVYGELSGSSSSEAKAKIIYNAISTSNYTDCGDDNLVIPLDGPLALYTVEFPKAAEYWNKNIDSFKNGGLQIRLVNITSVKHFHEIYIQVEYETPTITVTATASPAEGGTVTGGGTYESGSTVTATATANSGYVFSHWLVNGANVGNSNPISGVLTADTTVTAVFEKVQTSKIYYGDETAKAMFDTQMNKAKSVWYGMERIL